ncbi:MAG TPA: ThuA domain-containing protein [Gemmata sp.]|jgi:type 1 glutamine amidotransferase|nr:ThuA domain-containing protein [Gemmata sp.]
MLQVRFLFAAAIVAVLSISSLAPSANAPVKAEKKTKKLLLVTDSGGFVHDSVGLSEEILKKLGPENGFEVTCWRYTRDTNDPGFQKYCEQFRKTTGVPVSTENCGRVNKETLKNFDCVHFFTTGNPLTKDELADLENWVKEGGAFTGTHCATDTLYGTSYGALVGGYFDGHPWHQKIKIKVEDSKHAAGTGFKDGDEITDEIYQFKDSPYSREKLHIILSVDNSSIDVGKGKRPDMDYAISWCQEFGKGRTFYTSLGHRKDVWKDERFQKHLIGGINWAMKDAEGSATPSVKK